MAGIPQDIKTKLVQYKALLDEGILEQAEYDRLKNDVLAGITAPSGQVGNEDLIAALRDCKDLMIAGAIDSTDYDRIKRALMGGGNAAGAAAGTGSFQSTSNAQNVQRVTPVTPVTPAGAAGNAQPVNPDGQPGQVYAGSTQYGQAGAVHGAHGQYGGNPANGPKPKGKNKLIPIIAAVAAVLLIGIGAYMFFGNGGAGNETIPGGVEFGDDTDTVMDAARKLGTPEEMDNGDIWIRDVKRYGYNGIVIYELSNGRLCHVTFMISDVPDKTVFNNVVDEIKEQFGEPASHKSGTDGDEHYVWDLAEERDIRVDHDFGSVFVNFWAWDLL